MLATMYPSRRKFVYGIPVVLKAAWKIESLDTLNGVFYVIFVVSNSIRLPGVRVVVRQSGAQEGIARGLIS